MEYSGKVLVDLFLMFAGGKVLAEVFERLRQPAVVGELLAGVLLGPSLLALIRPNELTAGLAEIGAIFLLFTVGLETKPRDLLQVGGIATLVATLGVVIPFVMGFAYMRVIDHSMVESIFVGAAMVATSVGITARVLADAGVLSTRVARVILGAAVLDDILGMIVLAVVSSLSAGGVNYLSLAIVTGEAAGFSLLVIFFGSHVVGRFRPAVAKLRARNSAFALAVILCLGLSLASEYIGMAAIIGAFLAGLALADYSEQYRLRQNAHPIMEFLAPFFFVLLGAQVNLRTVFRPGLLGMIGVICLLAVVGKLIGCGLGALSMGWKDAARIGVGMVPRGEVGLIVAGVGLRLHTISDAIYTVVLSMSIVTTIVAPPILRILLPRVESRPVAEAAAGAVKEG
ncbi:MAG: cation:proton antiporter [Acidobacteriia bacterium]|nr:cation:proton antiporter [Terriglobia bacterium]